MENGEQKYCNTCGFPYDKTSKTECKNKFHRCQDCVWNGDFLERTCRHHQEEIENKWGWYIHGRNV